MSLPRTPRHRLVGGAVSLALLTALGIAVASPSGAPPVPGDERLPVSDIGPLPWPHDGQSAVELEGTGSLGERGGRRPVPIASLTKVMTAYVILKEHPLRPDEEGPLIEVDRTAAHEAGVGGESTVPVRPGERYSQRRLLELLLIPSGNNVARLLARWDSGSQAAFVAKMRRAAGRLGMEDTVYTGSSGIEPTTTSTAADQLRLTRAAMEDPVFRAVVATRETIVPGLGTITNTNPLLDTPGVLGVKTGSSTLAGGNLLWACEVRVGGTPRLLVGAVLHQRANTTPAEGLRAAVDASRGLLTSVRDRLAAAGTEGGER
ncbi:D-alanyl-D-alanine carboxypeptidase family protein [Streptomyces gardneri]|uniref:D-alanyl-D-alanine carboxypeptidase n=1 Tax=Streptomyces gardneri TaxID=66892 RepID=A0A4Y3RI54_9ACTN|nr:D-alanyl-D-alanine carboxypeptidase [Streptomyces gardneri]GEB57335.1 D-alanyl-D-alanine carboxypeptidase [Streptomyces gardneri]GHH13058.1 D-alanyl-D-alanine carboxypeptidase [Streptomyces gardneri]